MNLFDRQKEEQSILNTLQRISEAWNKADGLLFATAFTADVDYITFNGSHIKGVAENVRVHTQLWKSFPMRGSELHGEVQGIRFLDEQTAIVHMIGAVKLRFQKKAPKNRLSINTNVLVKRDGVWLVTAFHNCRIQKPGFFGRIMMKLAGIPSDQN